MSSTVFAKENPSPALTRRPPTKTEDDTGHSSQRSTNRRSLSGKFRSLFRKNSSSPNRSASTDGRQPPAPSRQRSPSPEPITSSMEAPHLQAPTVIWPFGKKKTKSTATTSKTKTKTKDSQKTKQKSNPPTEISNPVYEPEYQTSIRGQNFIPRTPELAHGGTGRTQSASSYETTTKGFRDYMIIDHTKSSQQVVVSNIDAITPPPYTSDRSRSPSINRHHLPDTSIEYPYRHDTSPPSISEIEVIPTLYQKYKVDDTPSLTTTQILAGKAPLLPPLVTKPPIVSTNSTQWQNTSVTSSNNTDMRSTGSSSMDVDVPKLNPPIIPLNSTSSEKKPRETETQSRINGIYSSSSTVSNLVQQNPVQPIRPWSDTYGSLPDAEIARNGGVISSKLPKTNTDKYPWISAIVEHHMRPVSVHYNENPSTTITSQRPQRFETSTTTSNDNNQKSQWSTTFSNGSPSSIHRHDGYIRPLTPPKPIQSDVTVIPIDLDKLTGRLPSTSTRPSQFDSPEPPLTYRSSTVIHTKDKHQYVDGGEIRTWCAQGNENGDDENNKEEYKYQPQRQQQYSYETEKHPNNRYSNDKNSNFTPATIIERDEIYDQSFRSYKYIEHTQGNNTVDF